MTRTCKNYGCQQDARTNEDDVGAYARKFCSPRCEVKYDHIKMDAQDAMRDDQ